MTTLSVTEGNNHKKEEEESDSLELRSLVKSLFNVKNVKSAFRTTFKRRENSLRSCIIVIGLWWPVHSQTFSNIHDTGFAFLLESFLWTGKGPTMYLFFRKQFGWGSQEYGIYTGIFGVLGIIAQYLVIPTMSTRLKMHDMTIGRQIPQNIIFTRTKARTKRRILKCQIDRPVVASHPLLSSLLYSTRNYMDLITMSQL